MAFDNDTGNFDFKFDEDSINELKQKYQEGVENHRGWITFQNKRVSMNYVHYVIKYMQDKKNNTSL